MYYRFEKIYTTYTAGCNKTIYFMRMWNERDQFLLGIL